MGHANRNANVFVDAEDGGTPKKEKKKKKKKEEEAVVKENGGISDLNESKTLKIAHFV